MTSSVTRPNNDTYCFNNILSFNTRTGPSCKWKIGELKLNMKWIYVHEPPEIYWKSIEIVKWTKMFQFVPCITALNYLWGKFHTDVNTISSPKKNLVSYILFYYHYITRIVARNNFKRERNEFMNFLDVIFRLDICLFWIASDAILPLSRVPASYLARLQTIGHKASHEALYTNRKCENETFLQTQGFYDSKRNIKGSFN